MEEEIGMYLICTEILWKVTLGKRVLGDDKGVTCSFALLKCSLYFFFQLKNSFLCQEDGLVGKALTVKAQ